MPTKKAPKKTTAKKTTKKTVAKKTAKKTPVKKTKKSVAKKATKKTAANKKDLVYAEDTKCFWVTNGRILNSLLALQEALAEMEKEVYRYHTDKKQNDFADWVADVLGDSNCAKDLNKAKTPKSAKTVVTKHLKYYSF